MAYQHDEFEKSVLNGVCPHCGGQVCPDCGEYCNDCGEGWGPIPGWNSERPPEHPAGVPDTQIRDTPVKDNPNAEGLPPVSGKPSQTSLLQPELSSQASGPELQVA
jgi:hypothetical protein